MLKVDDPVLLREEIGRLKNIISEQAEHILQLEAALKPPEWEPPVEINLTGMEARVIASLYKAKGEPVSKQQIHYSLYHDRLEQPDIKVVDVFVCKLRKKVAEYGLEIKTVWGRGYHLDAQSVIILGSWGLDYREEEKVAA